MTAAGGVRAAFTDPVSGRECELVIPPGGRVYPEPGEAKAGVAHPGCPAIADLAVELDAFWCPQCHWNGRVSGAWCADLIRAAGWWPVRTAVLAVRQPGQVPPDHPDAGKPAGWGEYPRDCDCGECP